MKLTLKNVKTNKTMSEETPAFTASLYVDGQRVGEAMNRGSGGPCRFTFDDPAVEKKVYEFAREETGSEFEPLDALVYDLLDRYEWEKVARANAKRGLPVTVLVQKGPVEFDGEVAYYKKTFLVGLASENRIEGAVADADRWERIA